MARCGWFARWVSLDTRSLALFRIVLGVVLLCDQLNNYGDIVTWLSDSGILPRYAVLEHHWAGEPWRWSVVSRATALPPAAALRGRVCECM